LRNFIFGGAGAGGEDDRMMDDVGGEWEREGLGRGLEERLEALNVLACEDPRDLFYGCREGFSKSSNKLSTRSLYPVFRKEPQAEYRPPPTKEKVRNNLLTVPSNIFN
jgi:hypothetical protein